MAEQIYTTALTTLSRVKNRLTITESGHDAVLTRMINGVSDFIEMYCQRKFVSRTYTQEKYSVYSPGETHLLLRQYPISALTTLEYAVGTPSNKNWTEYNVDDFELIEDGRNGLVRVYASIPFGVNTIRATYTAGYLVDWNNFGSSTHTLPADLTDLAERIVTRIFKRRELEGRTSETLEGNSVNYAQDFDKVDYQVINSYKRLTPFF